MRSKKGFTLIELMVVILIVGILAAVIVPIMRGRINAAKWSEGKAMMGTIATTIRTYVAEKDSGSAARSLNGAFAVWGPKLGFLQGDFTGAYFRYDDFTVASCDYDANNLNTPLSYTITATKSSLSPTSLTLDEVGVWGP